ncbi:MAG TPA: T9SS type A sorting domain-containing protein, partial [Chitinophagaceae bacterium]
GEVNGSISITARGGVAPYAFSLNDGMFGSANSFNNLAPGEYTIQIRDANSCIRIETVTITEPEPLTIALVGVTKTCMGSSNGSINITVSGGTTRYSFSWSGPNGFVSTREDLGNLAAGIYSLVVTDANGCATSHSVTIEEEGAITLEGSVRGATCFGSATGAIDVTVNGGSSPFTYNWSGAKGFKAATEDIAGVPAGAYTVMITSASGCSAQASYTVEQPANALSLSVTKSDIQSCEGKGSLDAVATGGAGLYTYSLNGGTAQSSGSFTDLSAGSYLVTVTDGQGCAVSTTVSIVDNGGDLYEANERQTSAKLINLEEIISARLSARDKDWFKFTASNAFAVHKVSVMRSTNGYLFDLYDSRGKMVTPVGSIDMEKTYRLTAGATYSVQVSGAASLECYQLSVMTDGPVTQARSDGSAKTPETASLQVTAYPNPSAAYFSVLLQGSSGQPVSLRVLDNLGRVVEARSGVAPNTTFTLGSSYRPGIYYLEVQQGAERKTIKLVKQS